jgi:hypothetical protein
MAFNLAEDGSYGDAVLRGVAGGNWSVVEAVSCSPVPAHTQQSYPRRRVSSTPRPIDLIAGASGILDHPLSRMIQLGDDTASRSRGSICPGLAVEFPSPPDRGRRECRVHAAPAVSCANVYKKAHTSIQGSGGIRYSLRNGFTAYIVLSPVGPGSLSPSPAELLPNLTPASGRRDVRTTRLRRTLTSRETRGAYWSAKTDLPYPTPKCI